MPDIISSIKIPQLIKDPVLTGSSVQIGKSGMPVMYVGGFSMVFPMTKGNEKWAMKVWHTEIKDVKERYKEISNFLIGKNTDYFANFAYVENGLLVNGQMLDTNRMRWIEGNLLKDFLKENLNNKKKLIEFTEKFSALAKELHKQSISHGDLQHGNIIIQKNGEIKLVDYDSICVPSIEGKNEFVTGLKGYQHPSRFSTSKCSIKADYFSELVIYLSVLAISEKAELWNKYKVNDTEVLLFSQDDFQNFNQSEIKNDLLNLSPKIKILVGILEQYLKEKNFNNLLPFEYYLQPPEILKFECEDYYKEIVESEEILVEWQTEYAKEISISSYGKVPLNGSKKLTLTKDTTLILEASGYFDKVFSKPISIKVHPLPVITSFKPARDKITKGESTNLEWKVLNATTIFINGIDVTNETKKGIGVFSVTPSNSGKYFIEAHSFKSRKIIKDYTEIKVFSPVKSLSFNADKPFTIQTQPVKLFWNVLNANKVIIEPEIGDVTGLTEILVFPSKSTTYRLIATNDLYKNELKTFRIEVLQLPQIQSVQVPKPPKIDNLVLPNIGLNVSLDINKLQNVVPNNISRNSSTFSSRNFISQPFALLGKFLQKEINLKKIFAKTK